MNPLNNDEIIEPLGALKEKAEAEKLEKEALELARKIKEKAEQEKRKCKHPNHRTYHVNKNGRCKKAWKCPDLQTKGCAATATI